MDLAPQLPTLVMLGVLDERKKLHDRWRVRGHHQEIVREPAAFRVLEFELARFLVVKLDPPRAREVAPDGRLLDVLRGILGLSQNPTSASRIRKARFDK